LIDISEEVQDFERLKDDIWTPTDSVILKSVKMEAVDDIPTENQSFTVEHDLPDIEIEKNAPLLSLAVRQIVAQLVEYNDTDGPFITITGKYETDERYPISIVFSDNGSEIPHSDRSAIEDETEEPLRHASGVGLWTAHWAVTRLGEIEKQAWAEIRALIEDAVETFCAPEQGYGEQIQMLQWALTWDLNSRLLAEVLGCHRGHARRFEYEHGEGAGEKEWVAWRRASNMNTRQRADVRECDEVCVRCGGEEDLTVHHVCLSTTRPNGPRRTSWRC